MTYLLTLTSLLFILNRHPLTIGLLLILISIFYALTIAFRRTRSWFAYILILVFLRGLIILVIYITSLASNENIKINWKIIITSFWFSVIIFFTLKIEIKKSSTNRIYFFDSAPFTIIYKTYNKILREISLLLILYLLVVLIAAIKIISLKKGPLKINK